MFQANKGIFKHYFIGDFIKNKEDRESFEIYYQNKIACIMMSGLLGLHISAKEKYAITVTNPQTGESCQLKQQCEPPFTNGNEGEFFESDMDSLLKFEQFLIKQMQEKIGAKRKIEYLEDAEYTLFNYLRTHSVSTDFLKERFNKLMVSAGEEIYYTRPESLSLDEDVLLSAAYAGINWLNKRIKTEPEREISLEEIVGALRLRLARQMKYPMDMRNFERRISSNYTKQLRDTSYWEYIAIAKNWEQIDQM